jgi:hypothetical protein
MGKMQFLRLVVYSYPWSAAAYNGGRRFEKLACI